MASGECDVSILLSPSQTAELSLDRTREGRRALRVQDPVVGSDLVSAVQERLATYPGDRNGVKYAILVRRSGDRSTDTADSENPFFSETLEVPDTIYAEDLKQIIAEILVVEPI